MTVSAEDNDDLNGPHSSRSERYSFKVVTQEELLSLLYQKELNLRRRFERIITELKEIQQDLILHRTRVDDRAKLLAEQPAEAQKGTDEERQKRIKELESLVRSCADRSLHEIHQNANETAAVEESFRDIREEMVNNQVATRQMLERIDEGILNPLHDINSNGYPNVDELLGLFKFDLEKWNNPNQRIDETRERLGSLIEDLERILLEMLKLETFQEALETLKAIISLEDELKQKTDSERKKQAIEKLKQFGLDD